MFRFKHHFTQLFLLIALVGIHALSSETLAQKIQKVRETFTYSPPTVTLAADRTLVETCNGETALVQLKARATSPDGNPIRYVWRVSSGTIVGEGAAVAWNLTGAQPGQHKAYLAITSGNGEEVCETVTNTLVTLKCVTPKPVCPNVGITCPDQVKAGQPITFTSNLTGGTGKVPAIFNWAVSAGRIISGQGTNSITVDTTGLEGKELRAALTMGGYEVECAASCTIQFPAPIVRRRFDEYPEIARNDEKARLDNFTIELQNDPTATGYVIIYPGPRDRSNTIQTRSNQINDYMVNSRGFDSKRIITLIGPRRPALTVELWIRPQGAPAPTP